MNIDFWEDKKRMRSAQEDEVGDGNQARTNGNSKCSIPCEVEKPSMETESGTSVIFIYCSLHIVIK